MSIPLTPAEQTTVNNFRTSKFRYLFHIVYFITDHVLLGATNPMTYRSLRVTEADITHEAANKWKYTRAFNTL